jgi:uncharacterized protein YgiM (DUF1202 family)
LYEVRLISPLANLTLKAQFGNEQPNSELFELVQPSRRRLWWVIIVVVILATLACAFAEATSWPAANPVVIRKRLPTLTPTVGLSSQAVPTVGEMALVSTTPILQPTFTPASNEAPASVNHQDNGPILTTLVDLNVRAGPGLDYIIIGQLAQGQSSAITGQNPERTWWQIVYPLGSSSLGWVSADPQYTTASNVEAIAIVQGPMLPTPTVTPIAVPTFSPTLTPTVISQPTPNTSGWSFASVRADPDQDEDNLLLYGNAINTSNSSQEVAFVTGTFYDAQGQVIAGEESTYDYWLVGVVPSGGLMPFELTISGIQNATNLNLRVESQPSDETSRQDFEFSDVTTSSEAGDYCLSGTLRNSGGELEEYLVIVAVLYNHQDQVINFGGYDELNFEEIVGDQTLDFEVCVDPLGQEVGRYELQAWGL